MARTRKRRRSPVARLLGAVTVLVLLAVVATVAAWVVLRERGLAPPTPIEHRCVARVSDHATAISIDQAWWTSIIVGTSVKRGLPPRAASIAMATVYQETGIRNLDHGDRDSVGLFQQRPSQGWGSVEKIMDPYYSTGKFYDALVKVDNWRNGDINDVAQAVQRSGYPEAYRDHEADGRALASTLAGWTPGGFSCSYEPTSGDPGAAKAYLRKTLGVKAAKDADRTLTYEADSPQQAWTIAHTAIATGSRFGTVHVQVADKAWTHDENSLSTWADSGESLDNTVKITFAL
ncbi:hypothetical protein ACQCX2_08145 [Propionibacteriaceae bacterium Y1700]|uniref:hypothetical protein n=1 Tax=Microlunatus sp. Y1700 TaxID=3418487 RepID=UPI003DA6E097